MNGMQSELVLFIFLKNHFSPFRVNGTFGCLIFALIFTWVGTSESHGRDVCCCWA